MVFFCLFSTESVVDFNSVDMSVVAEDVGGVQVVDDLHEIIGNPVMVVFPSLISEAVEVCGVVYDAVSERVNRKSNVVTVMQAVSIDMHREQAYTCDKHVFRVNVCFCWLYELVLLEDISIQILRGDVDASNLSKGKRTINDKRRQKDNKSK